MLSLSLAYADTMSGLVAWWRLDEGSGTSTTDSSGNGKTGTLTNGPIWVNGKISNALNFDGTDDYVTASSVLNIGVGFNGTVTFWAKGSGSYAVSNERSSDLFGDAYISISSTGTLAYRVNTRGSPPYVYSYTTTQTSNINTWNFYAVQISTPSVSGNMVGVAYINDVSELINVAIVVSGTMGGFNTIDIGRHRNFTYGTVYFTGSIDDVRIYNRALSSSDISELYESGRYRAIINNATINNAIIGQ